MSVDLPSTASDEDRIAALEAEVSLLRQRLFDAGGAEVVKVPEDVAPLFREAEHRVEAFFRDFHADPTRAEISVQGQRYLLVRGAALSVEFFQMVRRLFRADDQTEADRFAARLLYDLAHVTGRNDGMELAAKMQLEDPLSRLSAGPVHFAYTGWANVHIFAESNPEPGEDFFLRYEHPRSFESDAWIDGDVRTEQPVCVMNAGYSSGWCENAFGIPLEAVEVSCRARGDDACRFVMAPPHRIADQVAAMQKAYPGDPIQPLTGGAPDLLARRDIEDAHRRGEKGVRGRVQAERRLLAYAHALEATRDLLRRKVEELEKEIAHHLESQRSLARTQRALDEITTAVLWLDRDMRVIYANQATCELFGIDRDAILDMSAVDIDRSSPPDQLEQYRDQLMQTGSVVLQSWYQHPDGRYFPFEVHAGLHQTEDGELIFCFVEEITDRLAEEQERAAARLAAEALAREKTELLATLSHEIRTPLTAIVSMIDLLRDAPLEGAHAEFLETAAEASDHILHLVERSLDFSRLESGQHQGDLEICDLRELLERVTRMVEPQLESRPVELTQVIDPRLPSALEIDASALQQVLLNLLSNAIKMTDRGSVLLRVRCLDHGEGVVQLHFEVEDSGPGIPIEEQSQVFEPFTRVGATERAKRGGAGLGLAICRRLVGKLGGEIGVRSAAGAGACFWFDATGRDASGD